MFDVMRGPPFSDDTSSREASGKQKRPLMVQRLLRLSLPVFDCPKAKDKKVVAASPFKVSSLSV
jgi:hypothetical protein